MKKLISFLLCACLIFTFGIFALGSGESETEEQGSQKVEAAEKPESSSNKLGDYQLEIKGCRLAKDFEGKDIVIVKYTFTNNSDDATSFTFAFDDNAYQDGIGLNGSYFAADSANYNSDNQTKDIQKGATLDVEVAYELNDTTTDVVVEVSELISFNDDKITKTFSIK